MAIKATGKPKVTVAYEGEETSNGGFWEAVGLLIAAMTIFPVIFHVTLWDAFQMWWALVW